MLNSKRILSVIAVVTLAIACMAGFAGCGSSGGDEPKSAQDVIDRYEASNPDNCNMKGDIVLAVGVQGMNMSMPIKLDFDINGKSLHGTYSTSMLGVDASGEMYMVEKDGKFLMYTKTDSSGSLMGQSTNEEGEWTVSETDSSNLGEMTKLDKALFENATFEKTDNGYLVTVKGEDMYAYFQKVAAESGDAASAVPEIPAEYTELINGLTFNFTFDKDCKLTEVSVPETKSSITMGGQTADMTISGNIAVSNHGQVAEIVVPEDVVNAAKSADTSISDIASTLGGEVATTAASDEAQAAA